MPSRSGLLGMLVAATVALSACHTMKFEVGETPQGSVVYDRKAFFLGGLVPTRQVDVTDYCPYGAEAIREQTTFSDGLLDLVTLSIYSPRSTWYYCAKEEMQVGGR